MKSLQLTVTVFILLLSVFSCADDAYIFNNKEEQARVSEYQGALIGQWVSDTANGEDLMLGINQDEDGLKLRTPNGYKKIEAIETMGDLGFIMELKNGQHTDKIVAKFKSYQKTTLMLMNPEGVDLGLNHQSQITLRKVKEEPVFTASSNDQ